MYDLMYIQCLGHFHAVHGKMDDPARMKPLSSWEAGGQRRYKEGGQGFEMQGVLRRNPRKDIPVDQSPPSCVPATYSYLCL